MSQAAVDEPGDPNATDIRIYNNDPYKQLDHLAYGYVDKLLPVFSGGSISTTNSLYPESNSNQSWMEQRRAITSRSKRVHDT
jgi:hypothetical protein